MDTGVSGFELNEKVGVEDEADLTVAEDGGTCEGGVFLDALAEAFDDDFLFADEVVHEEASLAVAAFEDDDDAVGRVGGAGGDVEVFVEPEHGDESSADVDHFVFFVEAGEHFIGGAEGFADGKGGDDVSLLANADDEAVDDSEGEGEENAEFAALVRGGLDLDFPGKFFDVPAHDVHADASSREIGDDAGGGETGGEDEVEDFGVGELRVGGDDSFFDGFADDAFFVEACAVVDDFDNDVAALVEGIEVDGAHGWLAGFDADVGFFDAVIDGVPDHVEEGVVEFVHDGAVEFGVFAAGFEFDVFLFFGGDVADDAVHFLEEGAYGNHAHGHGGFLELVGDAGELRHVAREALAFDFFEVWVLGDHGLGDDDFADEIEETVELEGVNFDCALEGV